MPLAVKRMTDLDLRGKRVLIREDLNVPVKDGKVTSTARIDAALPTLRAALDAGARVLVMSHLGRPKAGKPDPATSLAPVAAKLGELLGKKVPLATKWLDGVDVKPGELVLCENVRYEKGEAEDYDALAKRMAKLCDVFVMDAFGTAHRAQASTNGVARHAPVACAGPLLVAELEALASALEKPQRPVAAIIGGSKVSTKIEVLQSLSTKVDVLILGGGIANTILAATGLRVGKSLYEPDQLPFAKRLLAGEFGKAEIPLPTDVVVGTSLEAGSKGRATRVRDVAPDEMILDIGPESAKAVAAVVAKAGTVIWNGPLGVFEFDAFGGGTRALAEAIAKSGAFSIAGGGDTLAAIEQFGVGEKISYVSTGGGASLELLEGRVLPGVAALRDR